MVYLAQMHSTMHVPGRLLVNKQGKIELINVCEGLECSTVKLHFSAVLLKTPNSTVELEAPAVLCAMRLRTDALSMETSPAAAASPLPPGQLKTSKEGHFL